MTLRHVIPDLLLAGMVIADGKGHQLLKSQVLFDHSGCDKERGRNFLLGHAFLQHVAKDAELVLRVQGHAQDVLGQEIILGENDGRVPGNERRCELDTNRCGSHRRSTSKNARIKEKLER